MSPCQERAVLLDEYGRATFAYSNAASAFLGSPQDSYDFLQLAAEQARLNYETARVAYEAHKHEHGCA